MAPSETDEVEEAAFRELHDGLGIPREDQVVRPVAQRDFAEDGAALTVQTLLPEVTATAEGVYWHPVGADHLDQLVTRELFPAARGDRRGATPLRRLPAAAERGG